MMRASRILACAALFPRQVIRSQEQKAARQVGDTMQNAVMERMQNVVQEMSPNGTGQVQAVTTNIGTHDGYQS